MYIVRTNYRREQNTVRMIGKEVEKYTRRIIRSFRTRSSRCSPHASAGSSVRCAGTTGEGSTWSLGEGSTQGSLFGNEQHGGVYHFKCKIFTEYVRDISSRHNRGGLVVRSFFADIRLMFGSALVHLVLQR